MGKRDLRLARQHHDSRKISAHQSGVRIQQRHLLYLIAPGTSPIFAEELAASGWHPRVMADPKEAADVLESVQIDVGLVLVDSCSEQPWWNWLEDLLARNNLKWIGLIPGHCGNDARVWRLIESCFFDYHRFPVDLDRLLSILGHAYGMAQLSRRLAVEIESTDDSMIGASAAMQVAKKRLKKIAQTDAPVLITGETGTGKELAASFLHKHSRRASGPFVAVNCAALPATLIQSELFGHEKGAFTGAYSLSIGRFESANGGTIFLDEIGDLDPHLQVNLLRVLEQGRLRRVGGSQDVSIDVRVLAATHEDLEQAVKNGGFREDLYYRLNVLSVWMPPLRERGEDIEKLAIHFRNIFSSRNNGANFEFTKAALNVMMNYDWPGNVRELINRVQQAMVIGEGRLITPAMLSLERRTSPRGRPITLETARGQAERKAVLTAVARCGHNLSAASRELGIARATLYRLMEKYRITL